MVRFANTLFMFIQQTLIYFTCRYFFFFFLIHYIETFSPTCLKLGERILGYVVIFLRGSCLLTLQALNVTNDSSRNKITLTLAENIPRGVTKQGKIANVSLWQNCLTGEKAFTVMSSLHHPQRTPPPPLQFLMASMVALIKF